MTSLDILFFLIILPLSPSILPPIKALSFSHFPTLSNYLYPLYCPSHVLLSWSLFAFLTSVVTLSYILTPEGVESETTDKSKHVAFVFQGLDYRTQ